MSCIPDHWFTLSLCLNKCLVSMHPACCHAAMHSGSWTRSFGLLLMDQPVGTGLSHAASNASIPRDEIGMATHLYTALNGFFGKHRELRGRPFFITGEVGGG